MRRLFPAGCLRFETAGLDGSRESPRSGAKRKLEAAEVWFQDEARMGGDACVSTQREPPSCYPAAAI